MFCAVKRLKYQMKYNQTESNLHFYFIYLETSTGNKRIELSCKGSLEVTGVEALGVVGKPGTVKKFNQYCISQTTIEKNWRRCNVSLALVYGATFPSLDSVTKITYKCEEDL